MLPVLRRGNVRGAITAGLAPKNGAADTTHMLELAAAGKIECLVLLGADPLRDVPDADLARRAINGARNIIAIDTFITESTFGLPIYRWPSQSEIFASINAWWRANREQGKASVLFCYAFGKAQRILHGLDASIATLTLLEAPVLGIADAPILSNVVSGTLLVVQSGSTRIKTAQAALKRRAAAGRGGTRTPRSPAGTPAASPGCR